MSQLIKRTGRTQEGAECFEIRYEGFFMDGCFSKQEHRIYVWAVVSDKRGQMKAALDELVKRFGTNEIEFTQVIGSQLVKHLHGFKPLIVMHPASKEKQLDLRGKWK